MEVCPMYAEQVALPYDDQAQFKTGIRTIPHSLPEKLKDTRYLVWKRLSDLIYSSLALITLSPLLIGIAAIIRITSDGPAFYTQMRVGQRGKLFKIYKFRTMVKGADNLEKFLSPELRKKYIKQRKLANDPRITKFGSFLRKTSLDELPQLLNIFRGEMSIVGPRPMLPDETILYGDSYQKYIMVKPGLTGLWQIFCRNRTRMCDRARLDRVYIKNRASLLDLRILFKTVYVVFTKKGAC